MGERAEAYNFRLPDVVVTLGNLTVEQHVTLEPVSEDDPASALRLGRALADLAASGDQLRLSIEVVGNPPDNLKLRQLGLNPAFCSLFEDSGTGTPQPTATREHFAKADAHMGARTYNVLAGGRAGMHYYARYLDQFAVRGAQSELVGFNALRFADLAGNKTELERIRNFGEGSFEFMQRFSRLLRQKKRRGRP